MKNYKDKRSMLFIRVLAIILMTGLAPCHAAKEESSSDADANAEDAAQATSLFNGKDLSGWYTYQREPEPSSEVEGLKKEDGKYIEPIGLNKDPLNVFTVVEEDEEPAIRISGEVFGILVTEEEFENFHLSMEFKWGEKSYPPREDKKRDSGVLYHSVGKEGAAGLVWMRSVEIQVQEGDTGDLWCVDLTAANVRAVVLENGRFQYDPQAEFKGIQQSGNSRYCQKSEDFEKANGEWNRLDVYAYGRESIHVVNGGMNMHLTDIGQFVNGELVPLTKGKIQIQSEGAEVFYRDITIRPIDGIPEHFETVR